MENSSKTVTIPNHSKTNGDLGDEDGIENAIPSKAHLDVEMQQTTIPMKQAKKVTIDMNGPKVNIA